MSETQSRASLATCQKFGANIQLANVYNTADYEGAMVLCEDPGKSAIPPKFISIPNVDELKALKGHAHASLNEADNRPLPNPKDLENKITNPLHPYVCTAFNTYMYGNAESVLAWKELINELRFPMEVVVFGAGEVIVSPGNPLRLEGTGTKPILFLVPGLRLNLVGR